MVNKLFQLAATLLLVVLLIRIAGGNEQPLIKWATGRWGEAAAKTARKPTSTTASRSTSEPSPQVQQPKQIGCPAGTTRTDSIYLGESLALQFKKQVPQLGTIAQIETQLGQPNCKGTNKAIWLTNTGDAIAATQSGKKVQVSFSGF